MIQKTALFSSLPQNEIDYIISRCEVLKLKNGEALFSPGETATHFYILVKGAIRVFKPNEDGSADEIARFINGDTIGDFDFARSAEYDACAEAAEDSELIKFPGYAFTVDSMSVEEPGIGCNILLNAILMMTGRIKSANKLVLDKMSWAQELHLRAYEDSGTCLWKQELIKDEIADVLNDPSALIMLKPDRFKILVDSRGHSAGDEAMIKIALIMKKIARITGDGWALRFKSNEVGLIFNNCGELQAEKIAAELAEEIAAMEPVPAADDIPEFHFSATISWVVWPADEPEWEKLFQKNYSNLLETWRNGGNKIVRLNKGI